MKVLLSVVAALGALFSFAVLTGGGKDTVDAAPVTIEVRATGAQEVPAVTSPGSALARLTYDRDAKTLGFFVTVSGLSPNLVTASHIHRGAVGVNGPIVHFLSATGFTQVTGTIQLSDADIADLDAGRFYVNVHSVEFPGGFARGQIIVPGAPPASAGAVTPPSTGDGGLAAGADGTLGLIAVAAFWLTAAAGALVLAKRRV